MEVDENPLSKLEPEQIKGLFGTYTDDNLEGIELRITTENPNYHAPANFDARTKWGNKIHPIRDQGRCGSCWAFGATESVSDRFAIDSNGSIDVILSPQQLVDCDKGDYGCGGGYLRHAFKYLEDSGAVEDKNYPYTSGTSGQTGVCKNPT